MQLEIIVSKISGIETKIIISECRGTPLHIHAVLGQKEELSTAIHQLPEGTTAKSLTDPRGATPLHYAAANGKLDVCEILVAGMGSEMIYHTDNGKCSPLHRALYRRRAATITYLIQLNADIDTPDNSLDMMLLTLLTDVREKTFDFSSKDTEDKTELDYQRSRFQV
jgi:hypothetical protein